MSSVTEVEPIKKNQQPLGAMANIPPRRLDFVFSPAKTARYYYDNNAFKSSFLTALSSLFPHGESFFVQSVRNYREQSTDPLMKAQVAGFIGQEAMHSKEHIAFNKMATEQGYPVDKLNHDVGLLLKAAQKMTPNVAFDVYQKVSGNYAVRAGTMIPTTIIFFAVAFWFHARMLAADGQLLNLRQNWQGFKYFWGGKNGVFARLLPKYLDFFKPGFHPSQHDTDALLADWRKRLFGKDGSLTSQVKHPGRHSSH